MERSRVVVPKFTVGDDVVVPWEANPESFREQARLPYSLALKSVTFAFGSSLRLTAIRR